VCCEDAKFLFLLERRKKEIGLTTCVCMNKAKMSVHQQASVMDWQCVPRLLPYGSWDGQVQKMHRWMDVQGFSPLSSNRAG